ncbi:MAG: hypothetical protein HYZ29_08340 [Myxococcales bacterium]|nr:hypothetical protein [Myxococcales bacterium]
MIQGALVVAALVAVLVGLRSGEPSGDRAPATGPTWRDALAIVALLCAHAPELELLLATGQMPGFLPADARTHAVVARRLVEGGLGSGWIDSYLGGFPLATHYPIVGWLVIGLPMALGASPVAATNWVCLGCVVATPVLAYRLARTLGATELSSLGGALLLVWVSPLNPFVGSSATYFHTGLVSQCVVMPLVVLWVTSVLASRPLAWAALWANLAFLAHPQVALGGALLLGCACVVGGQRRWIVAAAASLGSALLGSAVVYGHGMRHLLLPFGWPPLPRWMQIGFGPDRLVDWFWNGELLDRDRLPVFTALWLGALVVLAVRARQRAARMALAATLVAVPLSVVGPSLGDAGRLGELALKVLQPLRLRALLPLVGAAAVVVAVEVQRERVTPALTRHFSRRAVQVVASALALALAFPMAAAHTEAASARLGAISRSLAQGPCGSPDPTSAQLNTLREDLRRLEGSRLWIDDREGSLAANCAALTGLESDSALPLATTRGVGAHVGFAWQLVRRLAIDEPGLAGRAEALGISHLLVGQPLAAANASDFELRARYGALHLYARRSGSGLFGVGCLRVRRSGPNAELAASLLEDAENELRRGTLFDRTVWTELVPNGPPSFDTLTDGCDVEGARLRNEHHAASRHVVELEAPHPVTLVLRVTAHPWWRWTVDGRPVAPRMVFPAYPSISVPEGRHRIEVTARFSPWVVGALAWSVVGPIAWALVARRQRSRRAGAEAPPRPPA